MLSRRAALALAAGMSWAACTSGTGPAPLDPQLAQSALRTYADVAGASYADALAAARVLSRATDALLAAPSEATLSAARAAWIDARVPYAQSEVFRFYDGPIDSVELLVNTWPIDEGYVEAAVEEQAARPGVIDDVAAYPQLDRELLLRLNGRDGETSVSTGYHVIEFLLWGRDTRADGPGARPASDFAPSSTSPLATRRRHYLTLAVALLVEHLEQVASAWRVSPAGSFRAHFLALPTADAVALALRGMGALGGPELRGERLTVPYETRDQENEHSCFSDTTQQDVVNDALGIENVCLGRYPRREGPPVHGPGVCALIASVDAPLGATLQKQIAASVSAAQHIPAPFDQALLGPDTSAGRRAIKHAMAALDAQTASVARAAARVALRHGAARAER